MKRAILIGLCILVTAGISSAADFKLEIKGRYFSPSDQDFKDIYGAGFMYGGEAAVGIMDNLDIFASAAIFNQSGELTFTAEETDIRIIPIRAGIKYYLPLAAAMDFYLGGGANYCLYEESNPIGEISDSGLGFFGQAGVNAFLSENFFLDAYAGYSSCKVQPADFEVNIGGLEAGLGLGLRF